MAPRNPELPEGTDKIVTGASNEVASSGGGFVARSGNDNGSEGSATDRLVSQVRDQVSTLRGQAGDKLRGYADDGKSRATTLLDDVATVIDDAARSLDERLGQEIGQYAHRASEALSSFSGRVRDKSVDDLVDDTRSMVRSSPAIAIAAAAVVGFALMRVVRSGFDSDDDRGGRRGASRSKGNSGSTASDRA